MPGPIPAALRERVMQAYDNGEGSVTELAKRFAVHPNSIHNWKRLRYVTDSLAPRPMGGRRDLSGVRVVDAEGEEFLRLVLTELPDSTMRELVETYFEEFGVVVHPETMRATIRRLGFRFKKGHAGHPQPTDPMWSRNGASSKPR